MTPGTRGVVVVLILISAIFALALASSHLLKTGSIPHASDEQLRTPARWLS